MCHRLQTAARHDIGETGRPTSRNFNVARNAYRLVKRAAIAWKVPLNVFNYTCDDGSILDIHYLHPKHLLSYFLENHPVLLFGTPDRDKAQQSLLAWWKGFAQYHPTHAAFSLGEPLDRLLPIALHGDEGRGKRRSQTTVFSIESVIGIKGHSSNCDDCRPIGLWNAPYGEDGYQHPFVHCLRHNMKGHSFLQRFPLFLLPGTMANNYKRLTCELITFLACELKTLFHSGIQVGGVTYRVVIVGSKGDLKWISKIACLTRDFEHMGRIQDANSCHQCLAGQEGLPAEDFTTVPCWAGTIHVERPWSNSELPCLYQIPFDDERPEWIYKNDGFPTLRLGVYRDFSASCIFLFMKWKYFGSGDMRVLLVNAHSLFSLWCKTTQQTPALRSFSLALFNYENAGSYVWSNTKGSDTLLLCKWIGTIAAGFMLEETDGEKKNVLSVILSASRLSAKWFDTIYTHGTFLNRQCASTLYETGQAFLQGYTWLADFCMTNQLCLFGIKPKCHFQKHALYEIYLQLQSGCTAILSPAVWDCSQNEDLIGRMCRLGRKIDTRVITQRSLEFYLIKAAVLLRRHMSEHQDLDK